MSKDYYPERYVGTDDYGGVHWNSGITAADVDAVNKAWEAVGVGFASPPPPCTALLVNGVARTGISGAKGSTKYFCFDVPAGRSSQFRMYGGTGDVDIQARVGTGPTTDSYHCRSAADGNDETCSVAAQTTQQRIYIMLLGYASYSGASLRASYSSTPAN